MPRQRPTAMSDTLEGNIHLFLAEFNDLLIESDGSEITDAAMLNLVAHSDKYNWDGVFTKEFREGFQRAAKEHVKKTEALLAPLKEFLRSLGKNSKEIVTCALMLVQPSMTLLDLMCTGDKTTYVSTYAARLKRLIQLCKKKKLRITELHDEASKTKEFSKPCWWNLICLAPAGKIFSEFKLVVSCLLLSAKLNLCPLNVTR
jgi:hypothetical protein